MNSKKRKTPRYQSFDYNSVGVYFITICTQNRRCILSRIVGTGVLDCPQPELTRYGEIADKYIKQLNDFYEHLSVEKYVIMPNHIHFLLWVKENKNKTDNGQSRTPVPTNNNYLFSADQILIIRRGDHWSPVFCFAVVCGRSMNAPTKQYQHPYEKCPFGHFFIFRLRSGE